MTVVLRRTPFSKAERELVAEAVLTGNVPDELPELADIALTIAEQLPDLLAKARLPDNSENRKLIVDVVLARWAMPKSKRPPRTYRRLARQ